MFHVYSAVTGEAIAVVDQTILAHGSVKELKQYLAELLGIPRFRLRLLQKNCCLLEDELPNALEEVQLVVMQYLSRDAEQEKGLMLACERRDVALLEWYLNQPQAPTFEGEERCTPLYVASSNASIECVSLLVEARAYINLGRTDIAVSPLCIAAAKGHTEVVRLLVQWGSQQRSTYRRRWVNSSLFGSTEWAS